MYTGKVPVVCPDSKIRMADIHFSKMYNAYRYSVRVKKVRVTGSALLIADCPDTMYDMNTNVTLSFHPDPYLMNSNAF